MLKIGRVRSNLLYTMTDKYIETNGLNLYAYQVSEVWRSYELDLINYQNKCRLIKGWDDLFTKVKEHINSVTAMKLSPYYKVRDFNALSKFSDISPNLQKNLRKNQFSKKKKVISEVVIFNFIPGKDKVSLS